MAHDVAEIGYSYGGFDWSGGLDTTRSWGPGPPPPGTTAAAGGGGGEHKIDYSQLQKVLCARCRVLVKDIQRARRALVATALATSNNLPRLLISVPLSVTIPAPVPVLVSELISTPVCYANTDLEGEGEGEVGQSDDIRANLELSSSTFFDQIAGGDAATATAAAASTGTMIDTVTDSVVVPSSSASASATHEMTIEVGTEAPHSALVKDEALDVTNAQGVANRMIETQAVGGAETSIEGKYDDHCDVEGQTQISTTENSLDIGFDYDQLATLLVDSASPLPVPVPAPLLVPPPLSLPAPLSLLVALPVSIPLLLPVPCTSACPSNSFHTEAAAVAMDTPIRMTDKGDLLEGDSSGGNPLGSSSSGAGGLPLFPPTTLAILNGDLGDLLIDRSLPLPMLLPMPLSTTQSGSGSGSLFEKREELLPERVPVMHDSMLGDTSVSRKRVSTCHTVTNMPAARCTDLSLGLLWRDIASQALTIPEPLIQREILDSLDSLLKDAGRFFLCILGDDGEHWDEFMLLQKVYMIYILCCVVLCCVVLRCVALCCVVSVILHGVNTHSYE